MLERLDHIIFAIGKLSQSTEFRQLIFDNISAIKLLLEYTNNNNLNFSYLEIGLFIYGLGELVYNIPLSKNELDSLIRKTFDFLLAQIQFLESEINITSTFHLLQGISRLIQNNILIKNKPSKNFIRDIFLNKVIADPSIINTDKLYKAILNIAFFAKIFNTIRTNKDI